MAFLIDAFARASADGAARLVLAGGVDAALDARARAAGNVTLLGSIDDAVLRRLYRTAAAVAVPSLAEGYGLVAAEAQACGAAVVAANTSALPEAVGDAGELLDPYDGEAWAGALRRFIRDPAARAKLGARAAARWRTTSRDGTANSVFAALAHLGHDRS
jgi:glycosyltransferase involved in cell wall biosynthesis